MNRKYFLVIAVFTVALFILPQAYSLYSGQHTWYGEPEEQCIKCHSIIVDELMSAENKYHTSFNGKCEGCHTTPNIETTGFWTKRAANATKQGFHAATTIQCITCHSGAATFQPEKYNETSGTWASHSNSLLNPSEAHRQFYLASLSTDIQYNDNGTPKINDGVQNVTGTNGGNAACIACHTHTNFVNNWTPNAGMKVNIVYNNAGNPDITFIPMNASE
jgi:hypothetical protein